MSDQILYDDLFDPRLRSQVKALTEELDAALLALQKLKNGDGAPARTPKQVDELAKATERLTKLTQQSVNGQLDEIATIKEQIRLKNSLARETAKLEQATSEEAQALEQIKNERREAAREARTEERRVRNAATAYGRLQQEVNDLEREYKELAAAGRLNTVEGQRLTRVFQRQKTALDRINQSAGDFRRQVGNYPTAFRAAGAALRSFVGVFGIIEGLRLGFSFVQDSVEIATAARGVEIAFDALGQRGQDAFEGIRRASRGTLDDIQIKTAINQFENFNLSLEETETLFSFLALRAGQTGQSVEQLQDSLVEGLSKESLLRLDNLGLSAARLGAELEKTGDITKAVAAIAREELGEAGAQGVLDDLARSPQAAQAAFRNLQLAIGQSFDELGALDFSFVTSALNVITSGVRAASVGFQELQITLITIGEAFLDIALAIPGVNQLVSGFARFLEVIKSDTGILELQLQFVRLGAFAQATAGVVKELTIDFINLGKAALSFAAIDFSSPLAIAQSARRNLQTLTAAFSAIGTEQGESFSDLYNTAVEAGYARLAERLKRRSNADAKERGETNAQTEVDARKAKLQEIADFFENEEVDIFDPDSVDGFVEAVDSASTLFRNAGKALQDEWAEAQRVQIAIKDSSLAIVNEVENATGVSFQLIRDLINGANVETADFLQFTGAAAGAILQATSARFDQQIQQNRIALNEELEQTGLTEEQKQRLRERYAEQEARLKRRQAQANKRNALFEIAVNTAVGVSKVLSQLGAFSFGAIAPVLAQGLAQAALVAARPIPEFWKGKGPLDNYEGLATVGERGTEVLVRDGQAFLTPATTTPMYVKRDDLIYPSVQAFKNEALTQNGTFQIAKVLDDTERRLIFDYEMMTKAMEKALKKQAVNVNNVVKIVNKRTKW